MPTRVIEDYQHGLVDSMIKRDDFTQIDRVVHKSRGYCDFEFTGPLIDGSNLHIKVAVWWKWMTSPKRALIYCSEDVPSHSNEQDALLRQQKKQLLKEYIFKLKLNHVQFGQQYSKTQATCIALNGVIRQSEVQQVRIAYTFGFGRTEVRQLSTFQQNEEYKQMQYDSMSSHKNDQLLEFDQPYSPLSNNQDIISSQKNADLHKRAIKGNEKWSVKLKKSSRALGQVGTQFQVAGHQFIVVDGKQVRKEPSDIMLAVWRCHIQKAQESAREEEEA